MVSWTAVAPTSVAANASTIPLMNATGGGTYYFGVLLNGQIYTYSHPFVITNTPKTQKIVPSNMTSITSPSTTLASMLPGYIGQVARFAYSAVAPPWNTNLSEWTWSVTNFTPASGLFTIGANASVPCFPAGTRVATLEGYKTVESLTIEDRIRTSDNRFVTPKIFHISLPYTTSETAPYRIAAGSFGASYPPHDLTVSPLHAILDPKGVWHIPQVAAKSNSGITQYDVGKPITYYHIECPDFYTDNLMAEGCVVESFRNKQAGPEVVYEWNNELNGFQRIPKEQNTTVGTSPHTIMIYA